jgi:hypothetical protein
VRSLGTSSRESLKRAVIRTRRGLSGIAIGPFPEVNKLLLEHLAA